jgi:hypothetical protein
VFKCRDEIDTLLVERREIVCGCEKYWIMFMFGSGIVGVLGREWGPVFTDEVISALM